MKRLRLLRRRLRFFKTVKPHQCDHDIGVDVSGSGIQFQGLLENREILVVVAEKSVDDAETHERKRIARVDTDP